MSAPGKGDHLILVDGSGFIFRAYFQAANRDSKYNFRSDGTPTGAVNMFCAMLHAEMGLASSRGPTHFAVIFDHSSDSFRNEIYPEYKANRNEPPEDLVPQFPLIREATRAFGLPCVEQERYEADDLIATYARQAREAGAEVTIISSDKDLMQLVGPAVRLRDPMKKVDISADEVREKFGVGPELMIDLQALAGDSTDNVPGAPGIGVKTAAQLLGEFGDLDTLLARAGDIKQPKRRQVLTEKADQIRLSRRLVRLEDEVPVETGIDSFDLKKPDPDVLLGFLAEMEFRALTTRIADALDAEAPAVKERSHSAAVVARAAPAGNGAARPGAVIGMPPISRDGYTIIQDAGTLASWLAEIRETGFFAVDLETTSLDEMTAEIVGIALATAPGRAAYLPVGHTEGEGDLLGAATRAEGQLTLEAALEALGPVLASPAILKIGQNLKYDLKVLARHGVEIGPIDDTLLLSYAVESGLVMGHGMDELSERHLGHKPIPIKELIGSGKSMKTFDKVPVGDAAKYAAEDADITLRLWHMLKPRLVRDRLTTVYETLERPLIPVLTRMELAGIKVDRDTLSRLSNSFSQKMAGLEAEIHALAGLKFNVGSPKQLGEILFENMSLPGGKKGKNGAWGTGADVLEDLAAQGHDLPARILDWRQVSKLKSTYTDALQQHINAETGRVHTSFSLAATSTGRLASTEPNLQNIPVRTEEGREIRKAFVPEPGNVLLSLDYSQIELRILAHIADIDALKTAFREGLDIHAMTASEVFGVPIEGMDPMVRRQAKAINFGIIYGSTAYGLSTNLRIPRAEAQAFIDAYFKRFPGIKDYMNATKRDAKERGYVETLFGRRIHTPGINQRGPGAAFAARAAINAPIQGSAADIIRRAMIRIPAALDAAGSSARMLLQVHDELVFEVSEDEADKTAAAVREVMEAAAHPVLDLAVPLVVDVGQGANWAEAH